ncbi:MAG: YcaO-like family protein [Pseudomonadota bacterium]|nr:YcaO-like family protein [Pseudomonadota bacterium]
MVTATNNREFKRYRTGTHRTVPPAETLARARPWLREMGITRVANVTGLDRLGIPVVMATRPNSRSISVSQGKGHELDAAKASAVMESVETWHAERIRLPLRFAGAAELRAEGLGVADLERLPRTDRCEFDAETFSEQTPIFWIEGRNLLDDTHLWLPLEMVSTDYTLPQPPGCGHFAANTNGLASGNTLHEALCHAIYEVVERDADALWQQSPVRKQQARGVDPESINDPGCRALLSQFERAGIEIKTWEVTSDIGIASFVCLAAGDDSDWADPEFGAGCHPAREIALSRALTEAAQARTTYIAGARDDIGAALYHPDQRRRRRTYCRELLGRHQPARSFGDVGTCDYDSMDGDLNSSLEQLRGTGIREVLAVNLSRTRIGINVAKVVIPGLEGAYGHGGEQYTPGERARAMLNLPSGLAP